MKSLIKLTSLLYFFSISFLVIANCDSYVPGQVLVKMKANQSKSQKTSLKTEMQAVSIKTFSKLGIELWDVSANNKNGNINHIISRYKNHPDIEYIEPNYLYELPNSEKSKAITKNTINKQQGTIYANDVRFPEQWYLDNNGLNVGGTAGIDINAPEAWDIINESPSVKVAISDSGIDWKHEDLVNNIWQNLGEDADGDGQVLVYQNGNWIFDPDDENGIDDDGNGYVDDFIGWDFAKNDNNPLDTGGHGTHVAGIIGAQGNNTIGIAGVSWNIPMAALKTFQNNDASCEHLIEALNYAVDMGFSISNNSWIAYCKNPSLSLHDAINYAKSKGHLFVTAAGNSLYGMGKNIDENSVYPASYPLDNIISVTSITANGSLRFDAHYGKTSVDIAAGGDFILSTQRNNKYNYRSGTSMAAPQVTAACALLWQLNQDYNYLQIKNKLINTATPSNQLANKCVSGGRLNLQAMLSESVPADNCIRVNDSIALVKLYEATDGANWQNSWNLNESINTWHGISLNALGCVSEINLTSNGLSGVISPSLSQLNYLTSLKLPNNNLVGNIPIEIGDFERIVIINLSGNNLVGNIPTDLGNLNLLQNLLLQGNQLIGSVPHQLSNLNNLAILNLTSNKLQGCYSNNLTTLCTLFNSDAEISNGNEFNADWSDFCNAGQGICNGNGSCKNTDIIALNSLYNATNGANWLSTWNLNEPVSSWYGVTLNDNGCVEKLKLANNNLSGTIPASIGDLANLVELQLQGNLLTGGIPPEIGDLFYLEKLVISSKLPPFPQLGGNIPSEIGNLKNLEYLFLHSNSLSGSIPFSIGNLVNLKRLDLYNNNLSGNIPAEIGNLKNCEDLSLAINQLTGNIPNEIGDLKKLINLQLYDNLLSGSIPPGFGEQERLITFALNNNSLSGEIPPELGKLVNIVNMSLNDNQLTGSIPFELSFLPDLGYINLCNNDLSGCFESDLVNLCGLNRCIDQGNSFNYSWNTFCATEGDLGSCDWVWPGDFNNDGIVDETDVLYWGLASSNVGSPRNNASSTWEKQLAPTDWTLSIDNVNSKHQDGDGDGIVDDNDIFVIRDNFNQQHVDNTAANLLSSNTITLNDVDGPGSYNYNLHLSKFDGSAVSANGFAFRFDLGDHNIESIYIDTENSSLEPDYVFEEFLATENTYHVALLRRNKTETICDGPLGRVIIIVEENVPTGGDDSHSITSSTIQSNGDLSISNFSMLPYNLNTPSSALNISVAVNHASCFRLGSASVNTYNSQGLVSYYWNTGETSAEITDLTPGLYEVEVRDVNDTICKIVEIQGNTFDIAENLTDCLLNACPTMLELYNNIPTGIYKADRTVLSNDKLISNSQITFKAGERIRLETGFSTKSNVTFKAEIENCE